MRRSVSLSPTASGDHAPGSAGNTAYAVSHLFSPGTALWTIAGNALQPVFDGGTLRYKQRAAEEALTQSLAQYRGTVLTASRTSPIRCERCSPMPARSMRQSPRSARRRAASISYAGRSTRDR